jgi:hypothetical protein
MSLGWKFYIKFLITFIPLSIMILITLFMPKHKALKFILTNKFINALEDWCWK